MSLTKKDLNAIQEIFNTLQRNVVALKQTFNTFSSQINKKIDKLEKTMNKRFDTVDFVLKDIIKAVTVDENERFSDHETRIRRLEQHNKIS